MPPPMALLRFSLTADEASDDAAAVVDSAAAVEEVDAVDADEVRLGWGTAVDSVVVFALASASDSLNMSEAFTSK